MKYLLAVLLTATLALGQAIPAMASGGGGGDGGEDPVVKEVDRIALSLTISQLSFTPSQIILMYAGGAFGMLTPEDIEKLDEPGGGGLFGKLFNANRKKVFAELARRNFVTKVGRAYKIGDMVFIDSMFFGAEFDSEATAAGREALRQILQGRLFNLGPASDPFAAMFEQQVLAMLFFMQATNGMKVIYRLDPKMSEAGGIDGVTIGESLSHPLVFLAFFAAIATGEAELIGNVWQIGGKVVIAAPLDEIFGQE